MDIKTLLQYLDDKNTYRVDYTSQRVDTSFSVMPEQYLNYAQKDLESGYAHQYINALSNINRALNCQLNRLLTLVGFYSPAKQQAWSFDQKRHLLYQFGIRLPKNIKQANIIRNEMEHAHQIPDPAKVMYALSVVASVIEQTDFYASNISHKTMYCNEAKLYFNTGYEVRIDISKSNASLNILLGDEIFKIKYTHDAYISIFKRHLRNCSRLKETVKELPAQ